MKLGFIGTGAITEAIVTGLLGSEYEFEEICLSARNNERATRLAALDDRVQVEADNQQIIEQADLLILAIRPQDAKEVLQPLAFRPEQKVLSLIATLEASVLQGWLKEPLQISRAIPLPAVSQRKGVTAIYPSTPELVELFTVLGSVVEAQTLDEFDSYAASSALMEFYFGVMESAAEWMGSQGASEQSARQYLTQIFLELARTASREADLSFAELRAEHSTPGGLNEQVHASFVESGGSDSLKQALDGVARRIADARGSST